MTQATPTNLLPDTLTSFIWRERELDEISSLLTSPAARLVTLTGAGGCGKTRLALALTQRLNGAFADGIWPVALPNPIHRSKPGCNPKPCGNLRRAPRQGFPASA